jgi:Spy/CpxP family protein refolding chaperone
MKIKSSLAVAAAAAMLAGAVAVVSAQGMMGPGDMGHVGMRGPLAEGGPGMHGRFGAIGLPLHRLELTQEQQAKVQSILDEQRPALHELRQQLRDGEIAFRAAHPLTELNETAIRDHVAAQAKIQADLEVAIARVRSQVVALLTPEQVKTLQELQSRMHERMQERMRYGAERHEAPATPVTQ